MHPYALAYAAASGGYPPLMPINTQQPPPYPKRVTGVAKQKRTAQKRRNRNRALKRK